jgi:hypothetical protein
VVDTDRVPSTEGGFDATTPADSVTNGTNWFGGRSPGRPRSVSGAGASSDPVERDPGHRRDDSETAGEAPPVTRERLVHPFGRELEVIACDETE